MSYLKTFFYVLKKSFTSASYYKDVIKAPFGFSLKYFLFFSFLLSLIVTVVISLLILVPLNQFLKRFPKILVKVYPAELEIKINNGMVSTNVQEPYVIPLERVSSTLDQLKDVKGVSSDKMQNILVIDTNASVEDLQKYHTYALLTKQYLSYYKDDGRIETFSLKKIDNLTINKSLVTNLINKLVPFLNYLALFLIPLIFFGTFAFFTLGQFIYLLFTALLLFIVGKLISYKISYWKAFQIDLHLATIVIPLFLLASILGVHLQIPFLRLIIFTALGFFILNTLKNTSSRSAAAKK